MISSLKRWLHNSEDGEDSALEPRQPTHGGRAPVLAHAPVSTTHIKYFHIIPSLKNSRCESFHIYFRHSTHKVPPFSRDSNQPRGASNDVLSFPNCPRFKWLQVPDKEVPQKKKGCCEIFLGKLWHGNTKSWNATYCQILSFTPQINQVLLSSNMLFPYQDL